MNAVIAAHLPIDENAQQTEGEPGWDRPILPPGVRRGTVAEFKEMAGKQGLRVVEGGKAS